MILMFDLWSVIYSTLMQALGIQAIIAVLAYSIYGFGLYCQYLGGEEK